MTSKSLLLCIFLLVMTSQFASEAGQDKRLIIPIDQYHDRLMGFWLGQSIANWTGLVTEMDKIGGEGIHGRFYTRADWGKPDQPSIWGQGIPSDLSETIDWVLREDGEVWGSDDDTDIEYMYQYLMSTHGVSKLSAKQIRDGWLKHIYSDNNTPFRNADDKPENYLWVANQKAHDLMRVDNMLPPATGSAKHNEHYDMIDAQLSTEIFGLYAPGRPDVALSIADLPVKTVADGEAILAAQFYIILHAKAALIDPKNPVKEQLVAQVLSARSHLPDDSYSAHMFDDVYSAYKANVPWETTRDSLYETYQVQGAHGYDISSRNLYCNGCFASGINFGASLISLLYGEGDYRETVKLAVLMGWDSDNPAATWGGLLGFIYGYQHIQSQFDVPLSTEFNIHRTRGNFPNNGLDNFSTMADTGIEVTQRVILEQMKGTVITADKHWILPLD